MDRIIESVARESLRIRYLPRLFVDEFGARDTKRLDPWATNSSPSMTATSSRRTGFRQACNAIC